MPTFRLKFPDAKPKALTFSYDDGTVHDRRLVETFNKYNMKGTFNLNSSNHLGKESSETKIGEAELRELYKNHEVATHTVTHLNPNFATGTVKTYEVYEDRKALEEMMGYIVTGMAYPYGIIGGEEMENSMRACGIDYSRTVSSTHSFSLPEKFYRWNPTCHHNDQKLMELAERFLNTYQSRPFHPALFYCWGHSYEFNNNNNWEVIEAFCEKLANKEDIWYATNIEIYRYVTAYRSLVFSLNCSKVYNPSALTVWFECGGKDYMVNPNETIYIK